MSSCCYSYIVSVQDGFYPFSAVDGTLPDRPVIYFHSLTFRRKAKNTFAQQRLDLDSSRKSMIAFQIVFPLESTCLGKHGEDVVPEYLIPYIAIIYFNNSPELHEYVLFSIKHIAEIAKNELVSQVKIWITIYSISCHK